MRLLLDTHAFLWWIVDDPRLPSSAKSLLADGENEILLSAASVWEISIKASLGRLQVPGDFSVFMSEQVELNSLRLLAVEFAHAVRVYSLPQHHRDPFDRLLVAQSQVERIPILSQDSALADYEVSVVW